MWQFPDEVKEALAEKRYRHYVKVTFADTTSIDIGEDQIWENGLSIDRACSGQSAFEIGACVIGECKLVLNNWDGAFNDYLFMGATIEVRIETWKYDWKHEEEFLSMYRLGTFDVVEVDTNGSRVELNCYDAMYKFDSPLADALPDTLGYTYWELLSTICTAVGVETTVTRNSMQTMRYKISGILSGYRMLIPQEYTEMSCRNAIADMCASLGAYAYINEVGQLGIQQFDDTTWLQDTSTSRAHYDETYAPYFHDLTPENMTKFNRDEDNVTITGITVIDKYSGNEYSAGTAGHVITLDKNWCIWGDETIPVPTQQKYANGLYNMMGGATFRAFKATHAPMLSMQLGDRVLITDAYGRLYKSIVLRMKYTAWGLQETECSAEPASIINGARYTNTAQAVGSLNAALLPYDKDAQYSTKTAIEAVDAKVNALITGHEEQSGSAVSLADSTWTSVQTINVTAGIWLINYGVSFASNATGYRQIALTNSSTTPSVNRYMPSAMAISGAALNLITTSLYEASGAETLHVWAYQNSGAARNCWPFIKAVKLR